MATRQAEPPFASLTSRLAPLYPSAHPFLLTASHVHTEGANHMRLTSAPYIDPATLVQSRPIPSNNSEGHKVIRMDDMTPDGSQPMTKEPTELAAQTIMNAADFASAVMAESFKFSCPRGPLDRLHHLMSHRRAGRLVCSVDGAKVPAPPLPVSNLPPAGPAQTTLPQQQAARSPSPQSPKPPLAVGSPLKPKPKGKKGALQAAAMAEELKVKAQQHLLQSLRSPPVGGYLTAEDQRLGADRAQLLRWPSNQAMLTSMSSVSLGSPSSVGGVPFSNIGHAANSTTTSVSAAIASPAGVTGQAPIINSAMPQMQVTNSTFPLPRYLTSDTIATAFAPYEMLFQKQGMADPQATATVLYRVLERDLAGLVEQDTLGKDNSDSSPPSPERQPLIVAQLVKRLVTAGDSDDTTKVVRIIHVKGIDSTDHLILQPDPQPLSDTCAITEQRALAQQAKAEEEAQAAQMERERMQLWPHRGSRSRSSVGFEGFKFGDSAAASLAENVQRSPETTLGLSPGLLALGMLEAPSTEGLGNIVPILASKEAEELRVPSDKPVFLCSPNGDVPPSFAMMGECLLVVAEVLRLERQPDEDNDYGDTVDGHERYSFGGLLAPAESHRAMYRHIQCLSLADATDISVQLGAWPAVTLVEPTAPTSPMPGRQDRSIVSLRSAISSTAPHSSGTTATHDKSAPSEVTLLHCAQAVPPQLSTADGRQKPQDQTPADARKHSTSTLVASSSHISEAPPGPHFAAAILPSTNRPAAAAVDLCELDRYELRLIAESAAEEEMALIERARMQLYVQGKKLSAVAAARLEALTVAKDLKYIADVKEIFSDALGENLGADWGSASKRRAAKRRRRLLMRGNQAGQQADESSSDDEDNQTEEEKPLAMSATMDSFRSSSGFYRNQAPPILLRGGADTVEQSASPCWSIKATIKRYDGTAPMEAPEVKASSIPKEASLHQLVANNAFKDRHAAYLLSQKAPGSTSPRKVSKGASMSQGASTALSLQERALKLQTPTPLALSPGDSPLTPVRKSTITKGGSPTKVADRAPIIPQPKLYLELNIVSADGRVRSGRIFMYIQ